LPRVQKLKKISSIKTDIAHTHTRTTTEAQCVSVHTLRDNDSVYNNNRKGAIDNSNMAMETSVYIIIIIIILAKRTPYLAADTVLHCTALGYNKELVQ
jgi:GTP cyclohydrolase III